MIVPDKSIAIDASMVPGLLELRKTRCRVAFDGMPSQELTPCINGKGEWLYTNATRDFYKPLNMPYRLGQRLWVQEPWRAPECLDEVSSAEIGMQDGDKSQRRRWCPVRYEADWTFNDKDAWITRGLSKPSSPPGILRAAEDMPRFASRITLTITKIRVERLRDLTDLEALLEGIRRRQIGDLRERLEKPEAWIAEPDRAFVYLASDASAHKPFRRPTQAYRVWWDKQVSDRSYAWRNNPWVIVLEFTVKLTNIDTRKETAA